MNTYTVVGIYYEPLGQRFATVVNADTPQAAEVLAISEADPGLMVAGVIAGRHKLLDMYTDGYSFGVPGGGHDG